MTDQEKLRAIADYFDVQEGFVASGSDEVQQDLRRIADRLDAIEKYGTYPVPRSRYTISMPSGITPSPLGETP